MLKQNWAKYGHWMLETKEHMTKEEIITDLRRLINEFSNAGERHRQSWEEQRAKAMFEIAFELKELVEKYDK